MSELIYQRCFNHQGREAVARCPECRRYFCRECVTEHEDRLLCASCLANSATKHAKRYALFRYLLLTGGWIAGFLMIWLFFYYFGQTLLLLPDAFHDSTLWQSSWWRQP
ncbi:MAG: rhomboid family protein [Desulfobacteraceae bacterium]|nr:MAG: rhomboid family protein [Desulfobacteraceae bacterium]